MGAVMPVTKNITQSISIVGKLVSGIISIITNPFFWVATVLIFFPLVIANYVILFAGNVIIIIANIIVFGLQAFIFAIFYAIVSLINGLVGVVQGWKITIPVIDVDLFPFGSFPTFPVPTFPAFGIIPYLTIGQTSLFPNKVLFMWLFELFGWSFPLG